MSYFESLYEYFDQLHRECQDQIAEEWRLFGYSDGVTDQEAENPEIDPYMSGYEEGQRDYAQFYLKGPRGERIPSVDPGDCDWFYCDQDFDDEF